MFAKVCTVIVIIVRKQKQGMTNNEGIAKLQPDTLQSSKNDALEDYLLTQDMFLKMLSNEEQMNSASYKKAGDKAVTYSVIPIIYVVVVFKD